jgi:carboxyl-terminal processing protease
MLKRTRTYMILSLITLSTALLATVSMPVVGESAPRSTEPSIERWSQHVWTSAQRGDRDELERHLQDLPADDLGFEPLAHFQKTLTTHQKNRESARATRIEKREESLKELREHLEATDLSKALRSAVEFQNLSERLDRTFETEEIRRVIELTEQEIPRLKDDAEWLRAQELLFRLRTLFEDTDRHEAYQKYDQALNRVNHRVSLLSRYAPRQLHEMRNERVKQLGEEPLGEFNPARAVDWRERVDSIEDRMVRAALRIAGTEHIEGEGWRPLFEGGLDSLRVFATTTMLSETFKSLADKQLVDEWVRGIEREMDRVRTAKDGDLDAWMSSQLLGRIIKLNEQTLRLPEQVVLREFTDGAMQRLDQFSEVIWPDNLRRFRQQTEGNFVGVGILIRHNEKREIVVVNPLEGTPAYFAGVKPDDVIAEVNGESTVGWSLNDAVDEITGPKGEPVTLSIRRDGEEDLLEFKITRDTIRMHSVRGWWKEGVTDDGDLLWDWYIDPITRIGYIKLTSFNEDTYADIREAWSKMNEDGRPNGLILDLRFNPGGLLTSAVQISNLFLERGVIVSGENKHGVRAWPDRRARASAAELRDVPTVVLINQGAASGSEIVAGALQAHGAAIVVGERSYGKGSVQTVHNIAHNAALKLTTQYYRLPPRPGEDEGRLVHRRPGADSWGVEPDIIVPMSTHQVTESITLRQEADIIPEDEDGKPDPHHPDRPDVNNLLSEGIDPQLETALLILQARALGTLAEEQRHALLETSR